MKYFSMFSGIGGFELGVQQAMPGSECVGFSEINKWAISIYKRHFKEHKNYGDANKINPEEIPDFNVLVGGFPCQAFSIAGHRKGFDDTRGTLFFEIAQILEAKRPRLFVLENVKGLLSHDGGATFKTIISSLDELGYDVQWQVLNSKNFGVPQNRERVFIIGHLRAGGQSAKQIFPIAEGNGSAVGIPGHQANTLTTRYGQASAHGSYISEQTSIKCVGNINPSGNGANGNVFDSGGLCPTLTTNKGEGLKVIQLNQSNLKSNSGFQPYCRDRVYDPMGLSPALNLSIEPKVVCFNAERGFRDKQDNNKGGSGILSRDDGVYYALTKTHANHPVQVVGGSQGARVYDPMGIAVTQSALGGGGGAKTGLYAVPVLTPDRHNKRIRRLMPIECERLQGFPDNWTQYGADGEQISDSQRYKCCGNAVTVNVVAAVFTELESDL